MKKDDLCRSRTGESEPAALFGFASVWRAYLACRRRKRGTAQAQRYEMAVLDQVENTAWALQQRCFSPSRSICFIARQPKAREIHAAAFTDRVVHHLLVPHLEALFEPVFIYDLYSNRKNKGTHAAVDRLQSFMWSLTGDGQAAWFLQLDIRNFFNSIDRRRLFGLVRHRVVCVINRKLTKANTVRPELVEGQVVRDESAKAKDLVENNFPKFNSPFAPSCEPVEGPLSKQTRPSTSSGRTEEQIERRADFGKLFVTKSQHRSPLSLSKGGVR